MKIKEIANQNGFEEIGLEVFLERDGDKLGIRRTGLFKDNDVDSDVPRVVEQYRIYLEEKEKQNEKLNENRKRREAESERKKRVLSTMPVTTGDLHQEYEIIGPVYFQVSNKGLFSSTLSDLTNQYRDEINNMKASGTMSENRADWGFL